MTLWVNGAVANRWDDCQVPRGYVGLEAEGYRIEFRNVKVKPIEGSRPGQSEGNLGRIDSNPRPAAV